MRLLSQILVFDASTYTFGTANRVEVSFPNPIQTTISGGVAGNHDVPGITTDDDLVQVKIQGGADITAEFSIVSEDTIDNAGGTDTTGETLVINYTDAKTHDLFPSVRVLPTITYRLGEITTATIEVGSFTPWVSSRGLKKRDRVCFLYDDGSFELFRVKRISFKSDQEQAAPGNARVELIGLIDDLNSRILRWIEPALEKVRFRLPLTITFGEALDILFDTGYGMPSIFQQGTVHADVHDVEVMFDSNGTDFKSILKNLCDQVKKSTGLPCEYEIRHTGDPTNQGGGDPTILFDFVKDQTGWTQNEIDSLTYQATLRPVHSAERAATVPNLRILSVDDAQDDYFSRVYPFGGDDSILIDIQGIQWDISASAYDSMENQSTLEMSDDLIAVPDLFGPNPNGSIPLFRAHSDEDAFYDIEETVEPNVIKVTGDATGATWIKIVSLEAGASKLGSGAVQVPFVNNRDAELDRGRVDRVQTFPEIPPYENLFTNANIDADMSDGNGSTGFTTSGCTITDETDRAFVRYGTKAKKMVFTSVGDTCSFSLGEILPTQSEPWHSVWWAARASVGAVKVSISDEAGSTFPISKEARIASDGIIEYGISGYEMVEGELIMTLESLTDGATIYFDAITVTQSAGPWQLAAQMGRKAIFFAGCAFLNNQGGLVNPIYEGEFFDAASVSDALTVVSLTQSTGTATLETDIAHGFLVGQKISVSGANETEYNGIHTITDVPTSVTLEFMVDVGAASPATGNPTISAFIPVTVGSWVELKTLYSETLSDFLINQAVRVNEVRIQVGSTQSEIRKICRFERSKPNVFKRFRLFALGTFDDPFKDKSGNAIPRLAKTSLNRIGTDVIAPLLDVVPTGTIERTPIWEWFAEEALWNVGNFDPDTSSFIVVGDYVYPSIGRADLEIRQPFGPETANAVVSTFGNVENATLLELPNFTFLHFPTGDREDEYPYFTMAFSYRLHADDEGDMFYIADYLFSDGEMLLIYDGFLGGWEAWIEWNSYSQYVVVYDVTVPQEGTCVISTSPTHAYIQLNQNIILQASGGPRLSRSALSLLESVGAGTEDTAERYLRHLVIFDEYKPSTWANAYYNRFFGS